MDEPEDEVEFDSEELALMEFIFETVGEGNAFNYDGETYMVVPGALEKVRATVNKQLERALERE